MEQKKEESSAKESSLSEQGSELAMFPRLKPR
jgi:hypothetical protein